MARCFSSFVILANYEQARELFRLTGLPSIAERTGFRIEPSRGGGGGGRAAGYSFTDATSDSVEKLVAQMSMFGDEDRVATYSSAVCYFDVS